MIVFFCWFGNCFFGTEKKPALTALCKIRFHLNVASFIKVSPVEVDVEAHSTTSRRRWDAFWEQCRPCVSIPIVSKFTQIQPASHATTSHDVCHDSSRRSWENIFGSHSMWAWSTTALSDHNGVLSVWDLLKSYTLATMTNCSCDIPLPQLGCVVTDTWSPFSTVCSAACGMVMFVTCFSHCDCHLLADDCDTGLPRKPEGVRAGERTMTFKGVNTCRKWRCKHRTIMFLPTTYAVTSYVNRVAGSTVDAARWPQHRRLAGVSRSTVRRIPSSAADSGRDSTNRIRDKTATESQLCGRFRWIGKRRRQQTADCGMLWWLSSVGTVCVK